MANVQLDGNGNITGIFARPQDFSTVIPDNDPRIAVFEAAQNVPQSVTIGQATIALYLTPSPVNSGKTLLDDVNAAVAAAGGTIALWWAKAQTIQRQSNSVATLAEALNLSSAELDTLFTLAAQQEG
jgi:hypothetical protein